jgi:hypothetical protein
MPLAPQHHRAGVGQQTRLIGRQLATRETQVLEIELRVERRRCVVGHLDGEADLTAEVTEHDGTGVRPTVARQC